MSTIFLSAQFVDVRQRHIFPAEIGIVEGRVASVCEVPHAPGRYVIPGFIDAHVHVESSMLPPVEFARLAVRHGTVATVSDPHEIANVLGLEGIEFMLENARQTPFKFCFGAPSCVPATIFETAGAELDVDAVAGLLARPEIGYLSEVMNWPGVLAGDPGMLGKIAAARALGKPVDGHAPGLRGAEAAKYAAAGIETDHECYTLAEALDKIAAGMLIAIREGSAARNFSALEPLLKSHPRHCMLCSDDIHPDALVRGHVNVLVARAIAGGADVFDVLEAACLRPIEHYRLPVGSLRVGDAADFAIVEDLVDFRVLETWIDGQCVAREGHSLLPRTETIPINRFEAKRLAPADLRVAASDSGSAQIIEAYDGQLITGRLTQTLGKTDGWLDGSVELDVLKIVVVNRYAAALPAVGFIRGFGLKRGAIASSVAHDSHNVVAVGASDEELCHAINLVMSSLGGVCATNGAEQRLLPLEIAGLMSPLDGDEVARRYEEIAKFARGLGSQLRDPFMTLSFMALLVIPDLKMSDKGLFSGRTFEFAKVCDA